MSTVVSTASRLARRPVAIVDPRRSWRDEGYVERLEHHARRVDVSLILADGAPASACLEPAQAQWLELREGDIVGVSPLVAPAPCDGVPVSV